MPNRGSRHHAPKLTEDDARAIRELYELRLHHLREADKLTIKSIAEKFDVGTTTCSDIINRKTWVHVK